MQIPDEYIKELIKIARDLLKEVEFYEGDASPRTVYLIARILSLESLIDKNTSEL